MTTLALHTGPSLPALAMRGKVMALEAHLRRMTQVDIRLVHYFAPGLYIREMHVPAGVTITGRIHRTEHVCVLSKGTVSVTIDGNVKTLDAPYIVHAMPGSKRALHAHTDYVWANLHRTRETDMNKIEHELLVPEEYT